MTDAMTEVRLLDVSLADYQRSTEHHDELIREFALINEARRTEVIGEGAPEVPARVLALVDDLTARFAAFGAGPTTALREALERGEERIDLLYTVPPEVGPAAAELNRLLDEADEFCRAGDLLTLATPPEAAAFRRWFLDQFVTQTAGAPPTPWPRYGGAERG